MKTTPETQVVLKHQSDMIRALMNKQKELEATLNEERESHRKDVSFLTRVLIAALLNIPGNKVTLSRCTPRDADFKLDENISGEMIVILGNTH